MRFQYWSSCGKWIMSWWMIATFATTWACTLFATRKVTMYQPKMTHHCLKVLSMLLPDNHDNKIKTHNAPAFLKSMLHADSGCTKRKWTWNYWTTIGILNYLQAMTHTDITFTIHHCSRQHCNIPKLCHEQELKCICWYLASTLDKGFVLHPDLSKGFQYYGIPTWLVTSTSLQGRAIYSIFVHRMLYLLYRVPNYLGLKLRSIVTRSTTKAEYVVLSTAAKEAITLMNLLRELRDHSISVPFIKPTIHCKVFAVIPHQGA